MKLKIKTFALAAPLLALSTPAAADEPYAMTPSGATEALFAKSVVETSDYLANQCLDLGWQMISSTETTVVCEVPMSFGSKLLSALAGPSYATPPRQYFRFNLAGAEGNTRVQASSWQEIQTAFGQTQRTDLESQNYHNNVMGFFERVGGHLPVGTQFPNHAWIGAGFESVSIPQDGLRISKISEGGPADRAGLMEGDVILRIARERTKDGNDILDALHRAIKADTYEVEYLRGGAKMKVAVEREYRATIVDRLPPRFADPAPVSQVVAPLSTADELAKFAKLRDDGIISIEEFEAQKSRLLAGN